MAPSDIDQLVAAWDGYLKNVDWQKLTMGTTPKETGCGLLYELHDGLDRPNEEPAIADMRHLHYSGRITIPKELPRCILCCRATRW